MLEHLIIRLIIQQDYESLALLFENNNRPEITEFFTPFTLNSKSAYQICNQKSLDKYYVAVLNQKFIGFCMLRGWDEGYETPSFGVFVDYMHHGMGFGKAISQFALQEAVRLNCPKIRLTVFSKNYQAVSLYKSLGYEEIDRQVLLLNNQQNEKITMVKNLE